MADSTRILDEILMTSRLLAELDRDNPDGALRLRTELRLRRRVLLERLRGARRAAGEIGPGRAIEQERTVTKTSRARRRPSRHRRRAA